MSPGPAERRPPLASDAARGGTSGAVDDVRDLLVVSTWFPSFDDTAAGRFVADQIDALARTGRVRPAVVSFESFGLTGSSRFRGRQAEAIADRLGAAIRTASSVVVPQGSHAPAGIPIARVPVAAAPTRAAGAAFAAVHRATALDALWDARPRVGFADPALIHAHTGYPDGAAAARLSERLGRPLIVTEHSSMVARHLAVPAQREWYLRAVERASRFLAVSETLAAQLRAALPEQAAKIGVMPNAVHVEDFPLDPEVARVADRLLFVGYLKETKGIATLLEAFARVRTVRPAATLVLIGQSPTPEIQTRWETAVVDLGIAGAVTFAGVADRAGVAAAMSTAALFVHPSPRETFGVVAVEALASGLPVVATDSGGVTEILGPEPDQVGAVVPPDDPAALAGAIVATLERIDAFEPQRLRASVIARYGSTSVASRLVRLYDEVLNSPGDGVGSPSAIRPKRRSVAAETPFATPAGPGRSPAFPARIVLAGFDRARVAQVLRAVPPELRSRLCVATAAGAAELPADIASRSLFELDERVAADLETLRSLGHGGGRLARIARLLRHPGPVIRRRISGRGEPALLRAMTEAIAAEAGVAARAGAGLTGVPDGPLFVGTDGLAILAAAPLADRGRIRYAPGGPAWLADLWYAEVSGTATAGTATAGTATAGTATAGTATLDGDRSGRS